MLIIKFPSLTKTLMFEEIIDEDNLTCLRLYGYSASMSGHADLRERYVNQRDGILERRIESWKNNGKGKKDKTVVVGSVVCEIHYDIGDKYHNIKMKGLKNVLEALSAHASHYNLPNGWLEIYMDSVAQGSSGVVGWRDNSPVGPHAVLCLGYGMVETMGSTIADALCRKRKFQGSEKEFHTTISIFHELGHVFHQLHSPNHYFAMADIGTLQSDGFTEQEIQQRPSDAQCLQGARRASDPLTSNTRRVRGQVCS